LNSTQVDPASAGPFSVSAGAEGEGLAGGPTWTIQYVVRTQEKACSSDSSFSRKLSGTTDIAFWERRDRRCCVWQPKSGAVYLQSLWWYMYVWVPLVRYFLQYIGSLGRPVCVLRAAPVETSTQRTILPSNLPRGFQRFGSESHFGAGAFSDVG